ncbi:hypothetical protein RYH73_08010 [Olivibacter sp. CPCC 100613]
MKANHNPAAPYSALGDAVSNISKSKNESKSQLTPIGGQANERCV